jgi:hypothetical protein
MVGKIQFPNNKKIEILKKILEVYLLSRRELSQYIIESKTIFISYLNRSGNVKQSTNGLKLFYIIEKLYLKFTRDFFYL